MMHVYAQPNLESYFWLYRAVIPPGKNLVDFLSDSFCPVYGPVPQWLSPSLGITENESVIFVHFASELGAQIPSSVDTFVYEPNGTRSYHSECPFDTNSKGSFEATLPLWTFGSAASPSMMGIWRARVQIEGHFASNGTSPRMTIDASFSVGRYYANVSVNGLPAGMPARLWLDETFLGNVYGTSAIALGWLPEHSLSVEDFTPTNDKRYRAENVTIRGPGSYTLTSNLQYSLQVSCENLLMNCSDIYPINGSGWYNASQLVTITAPTVVAISNGTRAVFRGWSAGSATNPVISVVMNEPKYFTANYETQYYLKVISPMDDPKGEGWYDQGSTANFSVSPSVGIFISHVFAGWTGDSNASNATVSLTMNGPKTVTALWRTDYTIVLGAIATVAVAAFFAVCALYLRLRRRETEGLSTPSWNYHLT